MVSLHIFNKKIYFISISIVILSYMGFLYTNSKTTWISINVSNGVQGDAHLISKNSKHILIDAGAWKVSKSILVPKLKRYGVEELDALIISHPHFDHYGGTMAILQAGIKIKNIYMNMPTKEQMSREWWGGEYKHLVEIQNIAQKMNIELHTIDKGKILKFDNETYLKVLYAFDGINTPIGKTDINDMSAIIMLYDNNFKYLFTGDLNQRLGKYLAIKGENIQANILKFPHHGVEGYAPNSFFDMVKPSVVIVPTTKKLWQSKRGDRARAYVKSNKIETYVNGIHGDIKVTSGLFGYEIDVENK